MKKKKQINLIIGNKYKTASGLTFKLISYDKKNKIYTFLMLIDKFEDEILHVNYKNVSSYNFLKIK